MSIYRVPDPDDLIECPYDKTHMVAAKRFPYHLNKCRRNHRTRDFVTCPFNARHEIPRLEERYHIANCPDKALIYRELTHSGDKNGNNDEFKGYTGVPNYKSDWDSHNPEENWDDEAPAIGPVVFFGKKKKDLIREGNAPKEPELRVPSKPSLVMQAAQHTQQKKPNPDKVFSMSMAGIGRGRALAQRQVQPVPGTLNNPAPNPAENKPKPPMANPRMAAHFPNQEQSNEALAAQLTGLSIGRGSAMKPKDTAVGNMNGMINGHGVDVSSNDPEETRKKELRKLQKKLRQIENLEIRQVAGVELSEEEILKISTKDDILDQIAQLSI